MLRFLADESCDFAAVRALQTEGFDVLSVAEASAGVDDEVVMTLALRERRILLREDKDFGRLVFAAGAKSLGVVLVRFPAAARPGSFPSGLKVQLLDGDAQCRCHARRGSLSRPRGGFRLCVRCL